LIPYFGVCAVSLSKKVYPAGDLVTWYQLGKAAVTLMGTWESKCPTVLVLLSSVGVVEELYSLHEIWTVLPRVTIPGFASST